ncbi:MAG: hypothetical protein Q4F00_10890 [bacterium]|nr:hypothetical protein [bacterium]
MRQNASEAILTQEMSSAPDADVPHVTVILQQSPLVPAVPAPLFNAPAPAPALSIEEQQAEAKFKADAYQQAKGSTFGILLGFGFGMTFNLLGWIILAVVHQQYYKLGDMENAKGVAQGSIASVILLVIVPLIIFLIAFVIFGGAAVTFVMAIIGAILTALFGIII